MFICDRHEPEQKCLCEAMGKWLGDCELCEDGGSGITVDHKCYKFRKSQKFPLKPEYTELT